MKRRSKEPTELVTGIAWYERDQWQHLRECAADPEHLEETYDEWVAVAERAIRDLASGGLSIERVPIDTGGLIAWCAEQGRPIDSAARAAYVAHRLQETHRPEQGDGAHPGG